MVEKKRLAWFILVRLVVVSLFLAAIAFLALREPDTLGEGALSGFISLIVATYLFSIVSLLLLRFTELINRTLAYLQIIWDLLLVTILILLTGGIVSPYSFLYILAIINASVLLSRREALYTAALCGILYGAILDFQFFGRLASLGLAPAAAQQAGAVSLFLTIFVNLMAYFLTAFLTGYLAERATSSESALREKVIDFEELERLNSLIVSSLDSGLLTVTPEGRIRVFNRYAADLTGISQEAAYDKPLEVVIPAFSAYAGALANLQRQELEHVTPAGVRKIFGFKTVPFTDAQGNSLGVIIDFQDLTGIKRMETELKKADRLAAIGELAARIAHEIRNPLASISGSVQLIAQGERIDERDRKLLDIVLRETERLNLLIRDFLDYARPSQPVTTPVRLSHLLADLEALLRVDPRFSRIELIIACPGEIVVPVDRNKFEQVFWNLLLNAAEALPEGGTVRIVGQQDDARVTVRVTDNGSGIPPEQLKKIFEPFFTTKQGGTGLGLATVYRIVEAHSGRIRVESSPGEGTTFTLQLPAGRA